MGPLQIVSYLLKQKNDIDGEHLSDDLHEIITLEIESWSSLQMSTIC